MSSRSRAEARRSAFRGLLDKYGATPEDYDEGVEEDIRPYLQEEDPVALSKWVCVTRHGEKVFFLPCFPTAVNAEDRATLYAEDDIYVETPVEVFNLDTKKGRAPSWGALKWRDA